MLKTKHLFFAAAAVIAAGCASTGGGPVFGGKQANSMTVPLATSEKIPAAQGQVTVGATKNNNTALDVSVKHLAEPEKVASGATTFVVWQVPINQAAAIKSPSTGSSAGATAEANAQGNEINKNQPAENQSNQNVPTEQVSQNQLPQEGMAQNLGALTVDKDLTGTLKTITPLKNFQIFVTAENSAAVQQPSGEKLMWTTVNH